MPKRRFAVKAGTVRIIFHNPIEPKDFGSREQLMDKVRAVINNGLPPEYQENSIVTTDASQPNAGEFSEHEGDARTA
jgi:hypothetical protein